MKRTLQAALGLAKILPAAKIEAIAAALAADPDRQKVSELVGSPEARQALTDYFDALRSDGLSNEVAGAILLSSEHTHGTIQNEQGTELVLTGPSTPFVATRRTEQVLIDLIHAAEQELFLVSFVTGHWKKILDALMEADERGLAIKVLVEASKSDGGTLDEDQSVEIVQAIPRATIYQWTKKQDGLQGGKIHAKIALADQNMVFISSANFTGHAMEKNFEAGVLFRGGDIPLDISRHLQGLIDMKIITSGG